MVDYIDKKIISLVVEIIFMSFILVLTYIIWGKIDLSKYSTIASRYANNGEGLEVILKENESDVTLKVSNSDVKEMLMDGTSPKTDNFKKIALTDEGIIIFFERYQIAPYYFGDYNILISYSKLNLNI